MEKSQNLLEELNREQRMAVTYDKGPLLVLAGAGSGKTRVLTYRVAYFISEGKANAENVLLLTFTNKAAQEMRQRVEKLIGVTPAFAGTFHSFCARILRADGRAIGIPPSFLIYDDQDQKDSVKQILKELDLPPDSYNPSAIIGEISEAKNQMLSPNQYAELAKGSFQEVVYKVWVSYEKILKEV